MSLVPSFMKIREFLRKLKLGDSTALGGYHELVFILEDRN
jgi:hypothetical protein